MYKLNVLLIDDSPEDLELATYTLSANPFVENIVHFKDATTALRHITEEIDLAATRPFILLDMNMPGMGGLEFIRKIKADSKTKEIPIAVLTSTTELPDIKESMRLGVKYYIPKPIESEDLDKIAMDLGLSAAE